MLGTELRKLISNRLAAVWLWIGFGSISLVSFLMLTSEVVESSHGNVELIGSMDHALTSFFTATRTSRLNNIAVDITALGSATVVTLFVLFASVVLFLRKQYLATVHLIIAAVGSAGLTGLMKPFFERPRPDGLIHLVTVDGFSYPSGHSLTGAAVYFTFAVLLCNAFQRWSDRLVIISLSLMVILLIALSRVYLGVHFFSDVFAGVVAGIGWASALGAVRAFIELRRER